MAAALIHRAIGDRLTPVFVDNGLLRLGEADLVRDVFGRAFGMNLVFVDASERFLTRLEGVAEPEEKRRIVGDEFIRTFESQAALHGPFDFLAQGTLYPDVIKHRAGHQIGDENQDPSQRRRSPRRSHLSLVEPLRYLFKDEVREVGRALGLLQRLSTVNRSRVRVSPYALLARSRGRISSSCGKPMPWCAKRSICWTMARRFGSTSLSSCPFAQLASWEITGPTVASARSGP